MLESPEKYISIEKAARIISLIYALLIIPFSSKSLNLYLFIPLFFVALILSYVLVFKKREMPILPLNATIDSAFAILAVSLTGLSQSPFVLYTLSVIISLPQTTKPLLTFLYSLTLGSFLLLSQIEAVANLLKVIYPVFVSSITMAFFASFVALGLSKSLRNEQETEVAQGTLPTSEAMSVTKNEAKGKKNVETSLIWNSIDFQKELQHTYSLNQNYTAFLKFLGKIGAIPKAIVFLKKTETAKFIFLSNGAVDSRDLKEVVEQYGGKLPDEVKIAENGSESVYTLISDLPEIRVFVNQPSEENIFEYGLLKLTSDLFAYRTATLIFEKKELALLSRFSSLYDTAKSLSEDVEVQPLLESAAVAVKGLTGMEKAVVILANSPSAISLDSSKSVIKGKVLEHPEDIWKSALLKAASNCLIQKKPMVVSLLGGKSVLVCAPMIFKQKLFGVISGITSTTKEEALGDIKTLEVIAAIAATSLANLELMREREQIAVSSERDRIARDMHDSLVQSLFSMLLQIETAIQNIKKSPDLTEEKLKNLRDDLQRTIKETREYIYELYPHALTDLGLKTAIRRIISPYTENISNINLDIAELLGNIPLEIESAVVKIVQEAVSNAVRHSKASTVSISLHLKNGNLHLMVQDDGIGISSVETTRTADEKKQLGIQSMRKRVKELNGELKIISTPGLGTTIDVLIPLQRQ